MFRRGGAWVRGQQKGEGKQPPWVSIQSQEFFSCYCIESPNLQTRPAEEGGSERLIVSRRLHSNEGAEGSFSLRSVSFVKPKPLCVEGLGPQEFGSWSQSPVWGVERTERQPREKLSHSKRQVCWISSDLSLSIVRGPLILRVLSKEEIKSLLITVGINARHL